MIPCCNEVQRAQAFIAHTIATKHQSPAISGFQPRELDTPAVNNGDTPATGTPRLVIEPDDQQPQELSDDSDHSAPAE